MAKYVALLRGINVGGNNKIEMAKLKSGFESLGHTNVVTYINSGNVIFDTKKKATEKITKEIEELILETFKISIPVIIRDQKNILAVCKTVPSNWVNDKDYKTNVIFLWEKYANQDTLKLLDTNPKVDSLLYVDSAIIWHLKKSDYGQSKIDKIIGTEIYKNATIRNVNTVQKLNILLNF